MAVGISCSLTRVRAQLESLEMNIPPSLAAKASSRPVKTKSVEDQIQSFRELVVSVQSLRGSDQSKRIIEVLSVMREVMARDVTFAHLEVRNCIEYVRCWISNLPLRDELYNEYVRYANCVIEYSKKMNVTVNQVGWQRLATGILTSLDKKRNQCAESSHSPAISKKTKEFQNRLKTITSQVETWQDGIFSIDQLDKLMKGLNDILSYNANDWNPLEDPSPARAWIS